LGKNLLTGSFSPKNRFFSACTSSAHRVTSFRRKVDTGYQESAYLSDAFALETEEARCRAGLSLTYKPGLSFNSYLTILTS
jgi:hypothetical protein